MVAKAECLSTRITSDKGEPFGYLGILIERDRKYTEW